MREGIDWAAVKEEAVEILRDYIRIDTTNPPGREEAAARYLQRILQREGLQPELFLPTPERANLLVKIGDGKGAFLLLHHMDVVPAERDKWSVDPFAAELRNGYIWGRGTLDTKGFGVAQLMAFLLVRRQGIRLKRPLWLMATADEETGGRWGVRWMLENVPAVREVAFVLNEGGTVRLNPDGTLHHYEISTAQKTVAQFRLRTTGRTGHGSIPHGDNASERLVEALSRLVRWKAPVKVIPLVKEYFRNLAPLQPPEDRPFFEDIERGLENPHFAKRFLGQHHYNAMVRNTHTLTVLRAGSKVNVIPSEAEAIFDCRLLPGTRREDFFKKVREVIGDRRVELLPLEGFEGIALPPSPTDGLLYQAIVRVARRRDPGCIVTPCLITGATDSRFFRARGIPCYDFSPFRLTQDEVNLIHSHDERISVENLLFAVQFLYELILEVAT